MTSAIKEQAHTPGPWTTGNNILVRGHSEIGLSLAFVNCEPASKMDIEARANARLIAAAPDMLEALKWAESALAPFSKEPAEKSGMALIRAAIARATGAAK